MKIAVLLAGIGYDSQKRTINGILDQSVPNQDSVYIFTCAGWDYGATSLSELGEYMIYDLPDFSQFDGAIVNGDTIHNKDAMNNIMRSIREAQIPCVSININYPDLMLVQIDNSKGFSLLVDHLIEEHQVRDVFFVSGAEMNTDADQRLNACRKTLEKHGYELPADMVYYGDYTYASGVKAVDTCLKTKGCLPDAFVCANDHMAVGVIISLEEKGYSVPEDVIVTGYDNSDIAKYSSPQITTINRGEYKTGEIAYLKLKAVCEGREDEYRDEVVGVPVFAESCGCPVDSDRRLENLAKQNMNSIAKNFEEQEILRNSATEFSAAKDFEDFLIVLERYVKMIDPEYFYLCLCGSYEQYNEILEHRAEGIGQGFEFKTYTETVDIPFAYEKGVRNSYFACPTKDLIPAKVRENPEGGFYIIHPLHFQSHCTGYCVFGNTRSILGTLFIENFVLNIDNALEFIRRQDTTSAMLRRLNRMWILDELTGAYNRAGFKEYSGQLMNYAASNHKTVGVIFADADGLKKVNDSFGHEEGDFFIKGIAASMQQTLYAGEQLCRYGGDEFVILMVGKTEQEIKDQIVKIQTTMMHFNMINDRAYDLDASFGYSFAEDGANISLEDLLDKADQAMYIDKYNKKQSKKG